MALNRLALASLVLVACGGDDTSPSQIDAPRAIDAADLDGEGPAPFTVTSPTITDGGAFPLASACTTKGGMNQSPQLVFTHVPLGTQSYAVVLTDLTNSLVHWALYDVPGSATGLPVNIDAGYAPTAVAGAHQTLAYTNMRAYAGPCPPNAHMYQFKVYALSTPTLASSTMATTKEEVVSTATAGNLGTATLTATFTP